MITKASKRVTNEQNHPTYDDKYVLPRVNIFFLKNKLLQVDLFHLLRILSCPCFSRNSGQASLFDTKWPNFWSKKKLYTKAGNLMIWRRWPVFLTDYGLMMYRFQTLYGPNHNQNPNKYSFKMPEKLFFYEKMWLMKSQGLGTVVIR